MTPEQRDFVLSGHCREVEGPAGYVEVRPPFVWEAVVLLIAMEHAPRDAEQVATIRYVLRQWLPGEVARYVCRADRPLKSLLEITSRLVGQGAPQSANRRVKTRLAEKTDRKLSEITWRGLVSDYAATFGLSPEEVRTKEPFPVFLHHLPDVLRREARWKALYLQAKGLQYMKKGRKKENAFEDLYLLAGLKKPETVPTDPDELREWQARQLDAICGPPVGEA